MAPTQASSPSKAEFLANAGAGTLPKAQAQQSAAAAAAAQEQAAFRAAAQQIRDAVAADPSLAELARQLAIDMTPDGLRIQILDEDGKPMFASGSAVPNDRAGCCCRRSRRCWRRLTGADLDRRPHRRRAVRGRRAQPTGNFPAERANATRRLLVEAGLPDARIRSVTGHADRDPLLPADPLAAANRRIAIVVLRSLKPPDTH